MAKTRSFVIVQGGQPQAKDDMSNCNN